MSFELWRSSKNPLFFWKFVIPRNLRNNISILFTKLQQVRWVTAISESISREIAIHETMLSITALFFLFLLSTIIFLHCKYQPAESAVTFIRTWGRVDIRSCRGSIPEDDFPTVDRRLQRRIHGDWRWIVTMIQWCSWLCRGCMNFAPQSPGPIRIGWGRERCWYQRKHAPRTCCRWDGWFIGGSWNLKSVLVGWSLSFWWKVSLIDISMNHKRFFLSMRLM